MLRATAPLRAASSPSLRLIDWSQRSLPLGSANRRMLGAIRTWEQLLEVVLCDAELVALAPDLAAAEIDRVLRHPAHE